MEEPIDSCLIRIYAEASHIACVIAHYLEREKTATVQKGRRDRKIDEEIGPGRKEGRQAGRQAASRKRVAQKASSVTLPTADPAKKGAEEQKGKAAPIKSERYQESCAECLLAVSCISKRYHRTRR
jgi:hypothetical protein